MPFPSEVITEQQKAEYFLQGGQANDFDTFSSFIRLYKAGKFTGKEQAAFNNAIGNYHALAVKSYFEIEEGDLAFQTGFQLKNQDLRKSVETYLRDPKNTIKILDAIKEQPSELLWESLSNPVRTLVTVDFSGATGGRFNPTGAAIAREKRPFGADYIEYLAVATIFNDRAGEAFGPANAQTLRSQIDSPLNAAEAAATANSDAFKDIVNPGRQSFEQLEKKDILELRQCALITELFYRSDWLLTNAAQLALRRSGRIYPVFASVIPEEATTQFVNKLFMVTGEDKIGSKEWFSILSGGASKTPTTLKPRLYFIKSNEGQLDATELNLNTESAGSLEARKEAIREQLASPGNLSQSDIADLNTELKELQKKSRSNSGATNTTYWLKNLKVNFNGTNISTARNDVSVSLTFQMTSIASLQSEMDKDGKIQLQELVTLPIDGDPDGGTGYLIRNQYSPNYNRVRLTLQAGDDIESCLLLDLATIDHTISRNSEDGKTDFTINYKGYFETVLNMPFNDALATPQIIDRRVKRSENIDRALNDDKCDSLALKKILEVDREALRREKLSVKNNPNSFLKRLFDAGQLWKLRYDKDKIITYNNGQTLDPRQTQYVSWDNNVLPINTVASTTVLPQQPRISATTGFGRQQTITAGGAGPQTLTGVEAAAEVAGRELATIGYATSLGGIMNVALDCLYEKDSNVHRPHVKNLNLRFVVGNIQIPDPHNENNALSINPLDIPIDVGFFLEWWNDTVVNKDLDFYPVGAFIRDLIERLINSVLFDTCLALIAPDEKPPVLRTSFFTSTRDKFFDYSTMSGQIGQGSGIALDVARPFAAEALGVQLIQRDPTYVGTITNYCVIYQQTPSLFRQLTMSASKSWQKSKYVPTIVYGRNNDDHNYVSNVKFTKTTVPYLREARYNNNRFGNLSLLSNVYDLSFTINDEAANTNLYPGMLINFILKDWGAAVPKDRQNAWDFAAGFPPGVDFNDDSNPHNPKTAAYILGFGGYYIIKSVTYEIGQTASDFKINVTAVFNGTDVRPDILKSKKGVIANIETQPECAAIYNDHVRITEAIGLPQGQTSNLTYALEINPSTQPPPPPAPTAGSSLYPAGFNAGGSVTAPPPSTTVPPTPPPTPVPQTSPIPVVGTPVIPFDESQLAEIKELAEQKWYDTFQNSPQDFIQANGRQILVIQYETYTLRIDADALNANVAEVFLPPTTTELSNLSSLAGNRGIPLMQIDL